MSRRLRTAVELVSDIGAKAFDLQHHSEAEIAAAVRILRKVNGPMFDWLVYMLASPRSAPATVPLQIDVCLCHAVTGGHLAINPQCPVHAKATAEE